MILDELEREADNLRALTDGGLWWWLVAVLTVTAVVIAALALTYAMARRMLGGGGDRPAAAVLTATVLSMGLIMKEGVERTDVDRPLGADRATLDRLAGLIGPGEGGAAGSSSPSGLPATPGAAVMEATVSIATLAVLSLALLALTLLVAGRIAPGGNLVGRVTEDADRGAALVMAMAPIGVALIVSRTYGGGDPGYVLIDPARAVLLGLLGLVVTSVAVGVVGLLTPGGLRENIPGPTPVTWVVAGTYLAVAWTVATTVRG